jgi:GT2 family glycosyltransferase
MFSPATLEHAIFDEDFFMYGEDAELGCRLAKTPGSMVAIPDILVLHEGSASSSQGSPFYEQRMVAAHFILARKLARNRGDWVLMVLARALTLGLRAIIRSIRFHSFVPLHSLKQGWAIAQGDDPQLLHARAVLSAPARVEPQNSEVEPSYSPYKTRT